MVRTENRAISNTLPVLHGVLYKLEKCVVANQLHMVSENEHSRNHKLYTTETLRHRTANMD